MLHLRFYSKHFACKGCHERGEDFPRMGLLIYREEDVQDWVDRGRDSQYLASKRVTQETVKHQSRMFEGESGWVLSFLYRVYLPEKKPIVHPGEDTLCC